MNESVTIFSMGHWRVQIPCYFYLFCIYLSLKSDNELNHSKVGVQYFKTGACFQFKIVSFLDRVHYCKQEPVSNLKLYPFLITHNFCSYIKVELFSVFLQPNFSLIQFFDFKHKDMYFCNFFALFSTLDLGFSIIFFILPFIILKCPSHQFVSQFFMI